MVRGKKSSTQYPGVPLVSEKSRENAVDPRHGIRQNQRTHFVLPRAGVARTIVRYLLFSVPPLFVLIVVLFIHVYPLKLIYNHSPWILAEARNFISAALGVDIAISNGIVFSVVSIILSFVASARFLRNEQKEFPRFAETRKVCVIGAGVGGILTSKQCVEEGLEVKVLEKSKVYGGVWRSRAWGKTMLTSSNMNTSFSDFVFPEIFMQNTHVGFATRDQWLAYLDAYVAYFNLEQHMHFGCEVACVVKSDQGGYNVTWNKIGLDNQETTETEHFHAVAVCSGLPSEPRPCPIQDPKNFTGSISHSISYRGASPFAGRRVLVVGTGESASDIVEEVAEVASQPVVVSQHSPCLIIDRDHWESPPDYAESRLLQLGPGAARMAYLKVLFLQIVFFGNLTTMLHKMPSPMAWLRFFVLYRLPVSLKNPTAICSSVHVTKSGCILMPISSGKAVARPAATRFVGGSTVQFEDGTTSEFDEVILANGYSPQSFPFLKVLGLDNSVGRDRYHFTFAPEHEGIGFIGLTRGQVGPLTTLMEMQARWFALVAGGQRRLPSKAKMMQRVERLKSIVRGKYATRSSWSAANYIARHEVLCEPKLLPLLFYRPLLVWKILTRSFASWQFRLNGPGAQPDLVIEAYESVQLRANIPGELAHHVVMVLIVFLSHAWWFVLGALPLPSWLMLIINGVFMPYSEEVF